MKNDAALSMSGRRPGRPRAAEPGSSVTTWMPSREHDQLVRLASTYGRSVSSITRRLIRIGLSSKLAR